MIDVVARREAILTRCYEIFRRAEAQYGVNLGRVEILFNLRGRVAGMACCRRNRFSGAPATDLKLRFNVDMIAGDGYDHILNDCVPHEIAHLVCYANPQLGANHDRGWKRVCVALGGNGERCRRRGRVRGGPARRERARVPDQQGGRLRQLSDPRREGGDGVVRAAPLLRL